MYEGPLYEGYCSSCFVNNSANFGKCIFHNFKTKEKDVVDRVKTIFPDVNWRVDQRILGGHSRRRPDLLLDMGMHVCIVEIDENKHVAYDEEHTRIQDIWDDIGRRHVVFIRFNPDSYIDENNVKHTSCWKHDERGIVCVPLNKETEWQHRINTLVESIRYWMITIPEIPIKTIHLFY